jgi:predicted DNA-binding protein
MSVDRLSVTVPSELGEALRALAERRGQPVSTIVTEAIAHALRLEALDHALGEADRRFGPIPEQLVAEAESALVTGARARKPTTRKPRR